MGQAEKVLVTVRKTLWKMGRSVENWSQCENGSQCVKWITVWKNKSQCKICVTAWKMSGTSKMGHSVENGSQCVKWITEWKRVKVWKMSHRVKNASQREKWVTLKNGSKCGKWVTVCKLDHSVKKGLSESLRKQCVVVWKMGETLKNGARCEKRVCEKWITV